MSDSILIVSVDLPYPPNDGGRSDIWGRVTALHQLGYSVHLLVMEPTITLDMTAIEYVRRNVERLEFVPRRPLLRSLVGLSPALFSRNTTLKTFGLKGTFRLVLAESEHVAAIFDNPAVDGASHVLRMHNNEYLYMRSLGISEKRCSKRAFFYMESLRYLWCAPKIWRRADRIWAISAKECAGLRAARPELAPKVRWLPPTLQSTSDLSRRRPIAGRVLFVGNLRGPINQDALNWYLDHVHPLLFRRSDYHLVVAGSTSIRAQTDKELPILDRLLNTERCILIKDPPTLSPIYSESAIFINPMQRGAGVKLKTVQAAASGIPVVSTTVGNEGTGLIPDSHIIIANSRGDFANALEKLLQDRDAGLRIAIGALGFIRQEYSPDSLSACLRELLQ